MALFFICCQAFAANDQFNVGDTIPLSFVRDLGAGRVSGLSLTVQVKNASTGAVMLASSTMTESPSGSGIYLYAWTPNLNSKTSCLVLYTVGGVQTFEEYITLTDEDSNARAF